LLRVRALRKKYVGRQTGATHAAEALRGVDLDASHGRVTAVVGQSGSGKSTLALCIAQLLRADSGNVFFEGIDLTNLNRAQLLPYREKIQLVFQEAGSALSPRQTALQAAVEPLEITKKFTAMQRREQAIECLRAVQLPEDCISRKVLELSGGQRQRVAIARALTLRPKLLILDEAFSGLDLPVQEQILGLLRELQDSFQLTYLLITHDLGLAAVFADEIAIMDRGEIVERGNTTHIFSDSEHPRTKAMLAAIPRFPRVLAAGGDA
jgi:ABC-type glutathione transport system ATPase component